MTPFRFWLPVLLLCVAQTVYGQTPISFGNEWRFARYLADKDAVDEAKFVLQHIDQKNLTTSQRDSLAYLTGWIGYGAKSLDSASQYLLRVSETSPFYVKSQYFGAYCLAFDHHSDSSYSEKHNLPAPDSALPELKAFQQAGLALLQRQYTRYDSLRQQFSYTSYALSAEETRMDAYRRGLANEKRRSPVLAGALSAVVPGLGKVYAGKPKQGIAAFLPVLTLGLLTWEGYRKDGPTSLRFLGFGSLFAVFYAGNIWGSAVSVKIRRDEFNRGYDNKILFDMHIPLRNLLNR